jgi:hypothetical protein
MGLPTPASTIKPEDGRSSNQYQFEGELVAVEEKGGTANDGYEMSRMGKKQELRVSRGAHVRVPTDNATL